MPLLYYWMNQDEKKEWDGFDRIYPPQYATDLINVMLLPSPKADCEIRRGVPEDLAESFYLIHPCCWDILVQQHALLAPPTRPCLDLNELSKIFLQIPLGESKGGFAPDWATDYAGPEPFFWVEGETEQNHSLEEYPEWGFLLRDPGFGRGFDDLFASPPLESANTTSPPIHFSDDGGDIFARLPEELLTEILVLLPTTSVRNLQLASRKMASVHLSSRYWRSRFQFPNELCHITLPPSLRSAGQVGERWIDWRRLCDQLLHPVGDGYGWWQNRKRIMRLNRALLESMSHRRSDGRLEKAG